MRGPVEHGPQLESALERTPRDLDTLQLFVTEREIRGTQGVVVTVHDELAVEARGGRDDRLIDARRIAAGESQIPAVAAGGAQLTHSFTMRSAALPAQPIDLGL